jgi:hypothetical protein
MTAGTGSRDGLGVIVYAGGSWAREVPGLVDELTVWEGVDVVGMPVRSKSFIPNARRQAIGRLIPNPKPQTPNPRR